MPKRIPTTHPMSQLRHEKRLTLRDVKEATGISIASLSRIEQWTQFPARGAMLSLIAYYDGALCPNDFFPEGTADLAKPGLVQPLDEALPEQETRQGEDWTAVDPFRVSELREQMEEIIDLLHAIDKVGDGIGGADGHAVSAVAFSAKTVADNVLHVLRVTGESRAPALGATPSRACACEVA